MNTPWFRMYSEVLSDRKLAAAALQCSQPRAIIVGAWTAMLCLANDSPDRGTLMLTENHPVTVPAIAAELGIGADATAAIVAAFVEFGLLLDADGRLSIRAWHDRQFSSDSSTERVATYRNRKRQSNVTETLHDSYSNTPELEQKQNRTETDKTTSAPAAQDEQEAEQVIDSDKPKPPTTVFVERFQEAQGYSVSNWGEAAANAKWMIEQHYTVEDAIACRSYLKTQPFWAEKPVTLAVVRSRIGEWAAAGKPATEKQPAAHSKANGQSAHRSEKTRQQQDYWDAKARAKGLPA